MLFINFKILLAIMNQGDNLKHKQPLKNNRGTFVQIFFPANFCVEPANLCVKKNFIPISNGF